jgi:hypothetical protein
MGDPTLKLGCVRPAQYAECVGGSRRGRDVAMGMAIARRRLPGLARVHGIMRRDQLRHAVFERNGGIAVFKKEEDGDGKR